jgi:hypothetical protein
MRRSISHSDAEVLGIDSGCSHAYYGFSFRLRYKTTYLPCDVGDSWRPRSDERTRIYTSVTSGDDDTWHITRACAMDFGVTSGTAMQGTQGTHG